MMEQWAKEAKNLQDFVDAHQKLEPGVQAGMVSLLKARVLLGHPMDASFRVFEEVTTVFRKQKAMGAIHVPRE